MNQEQIEALAHQITADLFTNGNGDQAERLVLWLDTENRDLGGWCYQAVVDRCVAKITEQVTRTCGFKSKA